MKNTTAGLYSDKRLISSHIIIADTFLKRLKGLMFKKGLPPRSGYFFPECNSIHTSFMRFSLDLLYLKKQEYSYHVVDVKTSLRPWRTSYCRKADSVIEFKAGDIRDIKSLINKELRFSNSF